MKHIFILAAVIMAVFVTGVNGQTTQFGVKAGLNVSSFSMNDNIQDALGKSKQKLGFQAGITADIGFTPEIFLLTGIEITQKGYKAVQNYSQSVDLGIIKIPANAELKMTANPLFIQLPLYFAYKIDLDNDMKFVPYIGPYLAYGATGKLSMNASAGVLGFNVQGNLPEYDLFGDNAILKDFDYGLGIGVGIDVSKMSAHIGYELGMANLANDNIKNVLKLTGEDFSLKTGNFFISLGYRF